MWLGEAVEGTSDSKLVGSKDEELDVKFVAIKKVDTSTKIGKAYADREISILKKIEHPHIVKLIKVFDVKQEATDTRSCSFIALSYAKGPTLERILDVGGAVGIPFAQVLSRQLISAVAYLHSNACIHRDLKPDNVIVTGSSIHDDALWDDGNLGTEAAEKGKWHIILVDFGFIRALTKDDIATDIALNKTLNDGDNEDIKHASEMAEYDEDHDNYMNYSMDMDESSHKNQRGRSAKREELDKSVSHAKVRDLSALGNRNYAAPEILNGAHEKRNILDISGGSKSGRDKRKRKEALAKFVADYGMDADAYSLGMVLRFALTGVPPGNDVREYIALRNNIVLKAFRAFSKKLKRDKGAKKKRKKKFRLSNQCPDEATLLVRGLTLWNPKNRTTVRAATAYPWVRDAPGGDLEKMVDRKAVKFLDADI